MTLTFGQTEIFKADWKALKLDDDSQRDLENVFLLKAEQGVTVAGAGGVRKMRFALEGRGKSGSIRVIFAHFPDYKRVYFLLAFGKDEQANLSKDDKTFCREMMVAIESDLADGKP